MTNPATVSRLLAAHRSGDPSAADRLFALVYDDLHDRAHRQRRRLDAGETLNTTALLHEAYLKLADRSEAAWNDRFHFFAVASTAMRHILVDYARRRRALKRGEGRRRDCLTEADLAAPTTLLADGYALEVLDLDTALDRLEALSPRLKEVVELRFFGGLTIEETAEVLGVTKRTVDRDWLKAKGLLQLFLDETPPEEGSP